MTAGNVSRADRPEVTPCHCPACVQQVVHGGARFLYAVTGAQKTMDKLMLDTTGNPAAGGGKKTGESRAIIGKRVTAGADDQGWWCPLPVLVLQRAGPGRAGIRPEIAAVVK